ncbi:MAG: hypothetical protein RRA94_08205 [Bacteroidota bacterium]|nr:hypothetical protein [Bacteroidota bacterium]
MHTPYIRVLRTILLLPLLFLFGCEEGGVAGDPTIYPGPAPAGFIVEGNDYEGTNVQDIDIDPAGNLYVLYNGQPQVGPRMYRLTKYDAGGKLLWSVFERGGYDRQAYGVEVLADGRVQIDGSRQRRVFSSSGDVVQEWGVPDTLGMRWHPQCYLPDGRLAGVRGENGRWFLSVAVTGSAVLSIPLPGGSREDAWYSIAVLSDHEVLLSGETGILIADLQAATARTIVSSSRLRSYERRSLHVGPERSIFSYGWPQWWRDDEWGLPAVVHCFYDNGALRWSLRLGDEEGFGVCALSPEAVLIGTESPGPRGEDIATLRQYDASGTVEREWRTHTGTEAPESGVRTVVTTDISRMRLLSDGSVLLSGTAIGWEHADQVAWLARMLPDGRLDGEFGK